jgi:PAS domain S-box-containing protein
MGLPKTSAEIRQHPRMSRGELEDRLHTLRSLKRAPAETDEAEFQTILHELEVYQLELELQNRELRDSQRALEESRDRYVDLYEFAPVAYVTLDNIGTIKDINLTGTVLLGVERQFLLERNLSAWIEKDDLPGFREHLRRAGAESVLKTELRLRKRDGQVLPVELLSRSVPGADASAIRLAITDLSERKRAEQERSELLKREQAARLEAEAANKAKDEFLAVVSHELRTPLAALLMQAELLKRSTHLSPATLKKVGEGVDRATRQQSLLIEDLLDISRIETGKLSMDFRVLNLGDVIRAAIDPLIPLAEKKHIQITNHSVDEDVEIFGDSERLRQIVANVLTNSIKFNFQGGKVDISLDKTDKRACLRIKDSGIGIDPSFLPKLFERFSQAEEIMSRTNGGLGVGLALVKHLVERHGGTVHAFSEGKSKGATFTLFFPLAHKEDSAEAEQPQV